MPASPDDGQPLPRACLAGCHVETTAAHDDVPDLASRFTTLPPRPVVHGTGCPNEGEPHLIRVAADLVAVADVEADLAADDAPPRDEGMCPAELVLADSAVVEWPVVLRCWDKAGHLMPHVNKVFGCRWDTSALSLPWPPRTAAEIVRELLAAFDAAQADRWATAELADRFAGARAAAELLPGVKPPEAT